MNQLEGMKYCHCPICNEKIKVSDNDDLTTPDPDDFEELNKNEAKDYDREYVENYLDEDENEEDENEEEED